MKVAGDKYSTIAKDAKEYSSGYEVFLNRTNFREIVLNSFKSKLLENMGTHIQSYPLRILDIGCGNGLMTERFLGAIREVLPNTPLQIDLVEPASIALDSAKVLILKDGIQVQTFNQTADDFTANLNQNEKFYDLIIASYVFYHIDPDIIGVLTNHLSEFGSMVITMGSYEHPLRKHPELRALSNHGDSNKLEDAFRKWKLEEYFSLTSNILKTDLNLNGLLDQGQELVPSGEKFFSFIYNKDFNTFNNEQKEALFQTVSEALSHDSGVVHPIHNLFWISRPRL